MSKVQLSVRLRKLRDGKDGQSCFKSIVFKRIAGDVIPTPSGGSYASPVPSGWFDGIPSEDGAPCYMSSRIFTSDGLPPQQPYWSAPALISDTSEMDICFSSQESIPPEPTGHGVQNDSVWHEVGTPSDVWMATCVKRNGTWGLWSINRIKGEDGTSVSIKGTAIAHYLDNAEYAEAMVTELGYYLIDDGVMVYHELSNHTEELHATPGDGWIVDGDLYIATDDRWVNAGRIKGEDGPPGPQGEEGETPFEWQVTPLVMETDERGLVQYSNMGGPLNIAYITGTWKGVATAVEVKSIGTKYKCDASTASYGTNQGKGGVAINSIACEYFDDDGNKISSMPAQGGYAIPTTDGYVIARVRFSTTHMLNNISKTYDVNIPWSVNVNAHFANFYHDNRLFESTLGQVTNDVNIVRTDVSQIRQTANNISMSVSRQSQGHRNLIPDSWLNLVDYRSNRGGRTVTLKAGHLYLLSVRACISQALSSSQRKISPSSSTTTSGFLFCTVANAATSALVQAMVINNIEPKTSYTYLHPNADGEYIISYSDYPTYKANGTTAANFEECYHVEWEQLEDFSEAVPTGWGSMTNAERIALLPSLATPWSACAADTANDNLIRGKVFDRDSAFDVSWSDMPDGSRIDGYLYGGSGYGQALTVHPRLTAGQTYTLSFIAILDEDPTSTFRCVINGAVSACTPDGSVERTGTFAAFEDGMAHLYFDVPSKARRMSLTFMAAQRDVEISFLADNEAFWLGDFKLEKGGRYTDTQQTDSLLATGIDIRHRKITLTADTVQFQTNQDDLAALINGEGVTARSFVATDAAGNKISSLNEHGDGAFIQYFFGGIHKKFTFGNEGITCYWGPDDDIPLGKYVGDIRWRIGVSGVDGTSDDWVPIALMRVDESKGSLTPVTCYRFSPASASANAQYDGMVCSTDNLNAPISGFYTEASGYTETGGYRTINGRIVRYICPYRQYSGGKDAGWLYELYRGLPATEHGGWTTASYLGCNRTGSPNHVSYD